MSEQNISRLETFCDGIFAIAITLLILEIKPPEAVNQTGLELKNEILSKWPSWVAFLLTFITLLIAWVNHHNGLKQIDKYSQSFIYANGFLMITVVIFPYSTAVLGRAFNTAAEGVAIIFYCGTNFIHSLGWLAIAYASIHPKNLSRDEACFNNLRKSKTLTLIGCAFNLSMTILACWYPLPALICVIVAWITYSIVGNIFTRTVSL
jgi:uncharacterized membrane protein